MTDLEMTLLAGAAIGLKVQRIGENSGLWIRSSDSEFFLYSPLTNSAQALQHDAGDP